MFKDIDFKDCKILQKDTSSSGAENILELECRNGRHIHVGWYGEEKYCIVVSKNGNSCYKIDNQPLIRYIEEHLQKVINYETAVFDSQVDILYKEVIAIIESWEDGAMGKAISVIEQLRDMGRPQKEVGEYLETYGLQYIDSDEPKWDFICDLLDRITGWCAEEFHIWR